MHGDPFRQRFLDMVGDEAQVIFFGANAKGLEEVYLPPHQREAIDEFFADPKNLDRLKQVSPELFQDDFFERVRQKNPDAPQALFDVLDLFGWEKRGTQDRFAFVSSLYNPLAALSTSPFSGNISINPAGWDICITKAPDRPFDRKHEIASGLSGIHPRFLKDIPGTDALWIEAVAIHEAAHCLYHKHGVAVALLEEIEADQETVNWLRGSVSDEMAQAWGDYRMISTVLGTDFEHQTSFFISEDTPSFPDYEAQSAMIHVYGHIVESVSKALGTEIINVVTGLNVLKGSAGEESLYDFIPPDKIFDTLEKLLERGAFDDTVRYGTHTKRLVEMFVGAYNRRIEGRTVRPDMDYGRIAPVREEQVLQVGDGAPVRSSDGAPVRVGGHSDLSGIFGAVADPNAPNRILVEHKHEHGSNVEGAAPGLKAPMH
ncbi:MAG: hypothetical protein KDJ75_06605 [Alphaproteobacteria bacterium]|nr:hypothetical protein [Alphaproteobacteria bacterium]